MWYCGSLKNRYSLVPPKGLWESLSFKAGQNVSCVSMTRSVVRTKSYLANNCRWKYTSVVDPVIAFSISQSRCVVPSVKRQSDNFRNVLQLQGIFQYSRIPVYHVETSPPISPLPYMVILQDFYGKFMGFNFLREIYRKFMGSRPYKVRGLIVWGGGANLHFTPGLE